MKTVCHIVTFLLLNISVCAQQYYVRGEVKDESGNILQNVVIKQFKTGYIFRTGSSGTFGIVANYQVDTFSFSMEGYHSERVLVDADKYVRVKLKLLPASAANARRDKLSSLTKDLGKEEQKSWFTGEETYASILENRFVDTKKFPSTGMSLDVDRASYSNIRRFITLNSPVPPDAVRIEEMLNYFNLNYHEPEHSDLFNIRTTLSICPWNTDNQLFYINFSAKKLDLDTLPPSHLVFLIDVSGSMDMPNRLPLLQSAFRLLVNNLRSKDSVAIVVYGGVTGVMLNTTSGAEKEKILKTIDELVPGGSTPGESGIKLAYSVAKNHFVKGGNNRVILATDGDFNVGLKTEAELDELISMNRGSGIYLTCLGVGMGNYKDSKIQTLAKSGNGNFAYLDNFKEAEKVLLKEFTKTLYAVADNVYMNVEFNSTYVKEYRLIGFDNKVGALRDSLSFIEGGEIGSGHSMLALFEITPTEVNKGAIKDDFTIGNLAEIKLQYEEPNNKKQHFFNYTSKFVFTPFAELDKCYHFSAAVAMFGSLLRSSPFIKNVGWNEIISLAQTSLGSDDLLQKEFIILAQQAKTLYSKMKKKKGVGSQQW
ncbi:MAG: von Willebrand factor type A domain-containing protein [Chitinophagaceae bacterium]|nr:von Willebrand factor type A domain-containing protein [Chitinophagaceae bacterium]MBL0132035.1 von Willebrand factor type A domain-containing protein [Chitinophagaceae bacterium]MBL0271932.1 von Willebrand factor type A domain-containing protein [Chitinophagaceae bacterium]